MYNYRENMKADIREVIEEEYDTNEYRGQRDELEDKLNDELWIEDRVTGNASGSYTFDRNTAKKYVLDNMELLADMAREYGLDDKTVAEHFLAEDWEYFDVSIRCYMLGEAIHSVLDDMDADHVFNEANMDYGRSIRKKDMTMEY